MTDLTFFTNEKDSTLLERFKKSLQFVQYFDVLVGYFRTSGFYLLQNSINQIEKIRILVGLNLDEKAYEVIEEFRGQTEFNFDSDVQLKEAYVHTLTTEMEQTEDSEEVESGIMKFLHLLESKKLEIRAHPSHNIHAKVYINRYYKDKSPFLGSVITGSSNFSQSGFQDQYEFNVELRNSTDVNYALEHFEKLWAESVEVSDSFIDTVKHKTWLNDQITPYQMFLKLLYEYFKEDINLDQDYEAYLPEGFLDLAYQKQAVVAAKKVLDTYNGVFLADVVGLGKTFISALLAQQLIGKKLIICPPALMDYWRETFFQFGIAGFQVESLGKLEHILKSHPEKFQYVFVDEAHHFRNEIAHMYENLHKICWGKKVILVTATPLNNSISDIEAQLKLFQKARQSLIPGLPNLEKFFSERRNLLKKIDKGTPEYVKEVKTISNEIRERILKYVMVRRTRSEIIRFFSEDMINQGLTFPTINDPHKVVYEFDDEIDKVFTTTLNQLMKFKYSRYMPLLHLKAKVSILVEQSQKNIGGFMKGVLVKRLESSFFAFQHTISRFIDSYESFIEMYKSGTIYFSEKVNVYELLAEDSEDTLLQLVAEDKVQKYQSDEFEPELLSDLQHDLKILKRIQDLWKSVNSDPKYEKFLYELKNNSLLKNNKIIVFSESAETAQYLYGKLNIEFPGKVVFYCSNCSGYSGISMSKTIARELIARNFDPSSKEFSDDVNILISTDVLAEGVNLHRSNIVINYDLPWNPTRVLQRVGRVNRVGTKHSQIEIFNFFPTAQSEEQIGLEQNIKGKLRAFQNLLGEDAKYITNEEEVGSFNLFGEYLYNKLSNKETYEGEQEERSELEFLQIIRDVRDDKPELFSLIKGIPKKARSSKVARREENQNSLVTFIRKGRIKKFFMANNEVTREISFFEAADLLMCQKEEDKTKLLRNFYDLLKASKQKFEELVSGMLDDDNKRGGGKSNEKYIIQRLKAREVRQYHGFTDDDEEYLKLVLNALEEGAVPRGTSKRIKQEIEKITEPLKLLRVIKSFLPHKQLLENIQQQEITLEKREVILSESLTKE